MTNTLRYTREEHGIANGFFTVGGQLIRRIIKKH